MLKEVSIAEMTPPVGQHNNGPHSPSALCTHLSLSQSCCCPSLSLNPLVSPHSSYQVLISRQVPPGPALTPLSTVTSQILVSNNPHENIFQDSLSAYCGSLMVMVMDVPIKLGLSYQR